MDPDRPFLSKETTFSRLKTILYAQQDRLTWNEKLKYFDEFRLTFWNLNLSDKAISTRLPRPANGKRELLGYLDLVTSIHLNSQSFDNDAAQRIHQEEDLRYSEVPEYTQCARERRLQVNYEPDNMPSKSPGNSRLRRQHRRTKSKSSQAEVPESPAAHTPSRPTHDKIVDLDLGNDAEDESESLHQYTSEVLPSIETTNTPPRRVSHPTIEGTPIPAEEKTSWGDEEGEVTGIWSAENKSRKARREKRERKAEVIDLVERNSPLKTSPPKSHTGKSVGVVQGDEVDANTKEHNKRTKLTSVPWQAGREQLARILGKIHPQFPLVPDSPNSASASSPPAGVEPASAHSMSVFTPRRSALKGGVIPTNRLSQKRPVVEITQKQKVFDLHSKASNFPNKRQRINGQFSESTTSSRESIDLDSTPPKHQPTARRSVLSQNKKPQGKNGNVSSTDEFAKVERQINPARRSASSNASQSPYFIPPPRKPSTPYEVEDDPIVDAGMTSDRSTRKETRNSYLPDNPYAGNSRHADSRPRPSLWKSNPDISKSKVLPSHPDDVVKKPPSNLAKWKNESAGSPDELAQGHEYEKRTTTKGNSEKTHAGNLPKVALDGMNGRQDFVELDDTDDEMAAKVADIGPAPLKKPKIPTNNNDKHIFPLSEAFSTLGLMKPATKQWRFVLKKDEKIFRIIDDNEEVQYEIPTRSFQSFEWSEHCAKVILHRLADGDSKVPSRAFLEPQSIDESAELRALFLELEPTLTLKFKKEAEFLDKVFSREKVKKVLPKPARQQTPEDVQLLGKNAEMRQVQKRAGEQDLKQKGRTRVTNPMQQTPLAVEPRRAEGRVRRMENSANADTIPSGTFYNKSSDLAIDHSPPPATRSSKRIQRREPAYQERTHSPTPPPVTKWTYDNPNWTDLWLDTVVYPPGPGHKRTATVDRGDIQRLDEEEFLNDSLVNFYLRYLEYDLEQNRPEVAKRIYFQNSFFYERLTKPADGKKGIDYAAVQRWTKGVDLFSKDYIIVPVCENLHWYVAIICNAPKLLKPNVVEDGVGNKTPTKTNIEPKENPPRSHSSPINLEDHGDPMKMESLQTSLEECMENEKFAVDSPGHRRNCQEFNGTDGTNPPESHPIANIVSDLEQVSEENPAMAKSTRKPPTDRTIDPNSPRIIILDSLGGGHPGTSKNLRDYLVAEMKDKHGKDINPPSNRQMHLAAKNLESQRNYSDCGLFLLSYIQKFLESPESFISGILDPVNRGTSFQIQPTKMRNDIREHLFRLQSKKPKRPSKPSDVFRTVLPKLASRDISATTGNPTQREPLHQPLKRTTENMNPPNGIALVPTNASTSTTHIPQNALRSLKPAAPVEASAKLRKPTATRSCKEANGTVAKEIVDLANGVDSQRTPIDTPNFSHSSNSKWRTISHPIDEDRLAMSSQVLTPKRSNHGSKMTTLLKGVESLVDSVSGIMGRAAGEKEGPKDIGNSVSSPVEIDDSPVKSGSKRDKNQQKRRSRSPSVQEFTPTKRQKSSPKPFRDLSARYWRGNSGSDEVLEPPPPGLRSPYFGDPGQNASKLSSTTTAQKNGNKSPDGQGGEDDEMLLLEEATEACAPEPPAKKSSSPPQDGQAEDPPIYDFNIHVEEDEVNSATENYPDHVVANPHSHTQKSDVSQRTHIRFS